MSNNAHCKHASLSPDTAKQVRDLVYKRSGISLEAGKESLLESRLRRRLRAVNISDPSEYLIYLNDNPEEFEYFVNAFTTNETCFFRTARVWSFIENQLFAQWSADCSTTRQVWSAASSTGEEAYSLAMACDIFNRGRQQKIKQRVLGSDISTEVLARAKAASYQGRTINRLQATRPEALLSYFVEREKEFKLSPRITNSVSFKQHNLFGKAPFLCHYDLVMLRNVLIYFSNADQEIVLSNIHRALKPGGILIVGESESLSNLKTAFEYCEPLIYQKKA